MTVITVTRQACEDCWLDRYPTRDPYRREPAPSELCVFCGDPTSSGIYIRFTNVEIAKLAKKKPGPTVTAEGPTKGEPVGDSAVTGSGPNGTSPPPEPVPTSPDQLTRDLLAQRPKRTYRQCEFCGRPCQGRACSQHRDLLEVDPHRGAVV